MEKVLTEEPRHYFFHLKNCDLELVKSRLDISKLFEEENSEITTSLVLKKEY